MDKKTLFDLDVVTPAETGAEIELVDASGEPVGIFVSVIGRNSGKYIAAARAMQSKKQADIRAFLAKNPRKTIYDIPESTDEEKEFAGNRLLAVCITGWRTATFEWEKDDRGIERRGAEKTSEPTVTGFDGKDHEFSEPAALAILDDPRGKIFKEQVDRAVHNDTLFMKL